MKIASLLKICVHYLSFATAFKNIDHFAAKYKQQKQSAWAWTRAHPEPPTPGAKIIHRGEKDSELNVSWPRKPDDGKIGIVPAIQGPIKRTEKPPN